MKIRLPALAWKNESRSKLRGDTQHRNEKGKKETRAQETLHAGLRTNVQESEHAGTLCNRAGKNGRGQGNPVGTRSRGWRPGRTPLSKEKLGAQETDENTNEISKMVRKNSAGA
jgi:hypothetical protein